MEELAEQLAARARVRARERAGHRAAALELVRARGELYSVELACAKGWSATYAKHVLRALETAGLLSSEHRFAPLSGHGRRYYRIAAPSTQAGVEHEAQAVG
jgi:predicted transcriptional regulator